MSEFSKHKATNGRWDSPLFYTHPQGYKFSVIVCANGHGSSESTHLTVGVTMMKGEYDDSLTFPFRGVFTVEVINWLQDEQHIQGTISISDDNDSDHRVGGCATTTYAPFALYAVTISHSSLPYNPTTKKWTYTASKSLTIPTTYNVLTFYFLVLYWSHSTRYWTLHKTDYYQTLQFSYSSIPIF